MLCFETSPFLQVHKINDFQQQICNWITEENIFPTAQSYEGYIRKQYSFEYMHILNLTKICFLVIMFKRKCMS